MNILDKIVVDKKAYLVEAKKEKELNFFKDHPLAERKTISLKNKLNNLPAGIISEFKRRSPSKQDINVTAKVEDIVPLYQNGGATAISVLTDTQYFHGETSDLIAARKLVDIPLLRKDFIIDPYQIYEAKAIGADLILLIAYCLEKSQAEELTALAHDLGIEVLYEIHNESELEKMPSDIDILGVNNRDLTNFKVDYNYAIDIYKNLPESYCKISESGISSIESYVASIKAGYKACLVGEFLMKENDPQKTIQTLLKEAIK